jgi:Protein of unknown function (DUF3500)
MAQVRQAPALVRRMVRAASGFLEALQPEQRAASTAPFDVPDHRMWTYLPGVRPGLSLAEMTKEQQALAMELLDIGCGQAGAETAREIMRLDSILRDLERDSGKPGWERRHAEHYWVRILGEPSGIRPWAWRMNGHHLAVHVTVVGDAVAVTPQFFGANPAEVRHGPYVGLRTLPAEEDAARKLLGLLTVPQRQLAIVSADPPDDILTRRDPVANPGVIPVGLAYKDMLAAQRDVLRDLIRLYFDRVTRELADAAWQEVLDVGLDDVTFSWSGSQRRGDRHYYAVLGATFLLEYDNTQNDANHVHTVWRDLRHDWGADLLAAHYAAQHD